MIDLFSEFVHISHLVNDKNFSFEVLLIEEEELRCSDGRGSWRRRGASVKDRKLLNVFDRVVFEGYRDFLKFLPKDIEGYFTNKILALELGISVRLAQKITYCLSRMGAISIAGKRGNALLFQVTQN